MHRCSCMHSLGSLTQPIQPQVRHHPCFRMDPAPPAWQSMMYLCDRSGGWAVVTDKHCMQQRTRRAAMLAAAPCLCCQFTQLPVLLQFSYLVIWYLAFLNCIIRTKAPKHFKRCCCGLVDCCDLSASKHFKRNSVSAFFESRASAAD